jgi:hypothetical protein
MSACCRASDLKAIGSRLGTVRVRTVLFHGFPCPLACGPWLPGGNGNASSGARSDSVQRSIVPDLVERAKKWRRRSP